MSVRVRRQTQSHPQAALQSVAGQSLRRLDRPGKNEALDGSGRRSSLRGPDRPAHRRPLSHRDAVAGQQAHDVGGVYREFVANEKLVFTWAWDTAAPDEHESLVTVTFKPDGDGTLLTLTHEQLFDDEARDGHEKGWIGIARQAREIRRLNTTRTRHRREQSMTWTHGHFHWNELMTRDVEKAKKFYADTMGWTFDAMPMPDGGTYSLAMAGGQPVARHLRHRRRRLQRRTGELDGLYRRR